MFSFEQSENSRKWYLYDITKNLLWFEEETLSFIEKTKKKSGKFLIPLEFIFKHSCQRCFCLSICKTFCKYDQHFTSTIFLEAPKISLFNVLIAQSRYCCIIFLRWKQGRNRNFEGQRIFTQSTLLGSRNDRKLHKLKTRILVLGRGGFLLFYSSHLVACMKRDFCHLIVSLVNYWRSIHILITKKYHIMLLCLMIYFSLYEENLKVL